MRRATIISILSLAGSLVLFGCGKPSSDGAESSSSVGIQNLVLEKEISGNIQGLRLGRPAGVAVDPRGFLYVTDGANNRVIRFLPDLTPAEVMGGLGREPGNFDHPGDIDVDRAGNSFICDEDNRRLVRLDIHLRQTLEIVLSDVTDPLKYGDPGGVAVGDNGELWMTDRERNRVAVFDLAGQFVRFSGDVDAGKGLLARPAGIAYIRKVGFVVCDTDNRRLAYFDQYGNYTHDLYLDEMMPTAIAIDSIGNAWVLDKNSGAVAYVIQTGSRASLAGSVLVGLRLPLNRPSDIVALGHGLLAIADTDNDRIAVVRVLMGQP